VIIGTAGHIDHGKTTLVRALTGVDTDRLPEERRRGISIELGYAFLDAPDGMRLAFIDVPGHERLVHTMLSGATGMDHALLLVAADDGVMPQTREHFAILELLAVPSASFVITKTDRADPPQRERVREQLAALAAGTRFAEAPIFQVSAQTGEGIAALRDALLSGAEHGSRETTANQGFRIAIDRVFVVEGAGTVVTGTVHAGQVKAGDELVGVPGGGLTLRARVRSVHAQNRAVTSACAGERCALGLAGVNRESLRRGQWLVAPPIALGTRRIDAVLGLWKEEPRALRAGTPVHVHLGATSVTGTVALLDAGETLAPGSAARVQLVLHDEVATWRGDRVVLRDASASRTIAGGSVLDPFAPARYRRTPQRLAELDAIALADHSARHIARIAAAPNGIDLAQVYRAEGSIPGSDTVDAHDPPAHADSAAGRDGNASPLTARDGEAIYALGAAHRDLHAGQALAMLARFHEQHPDELGPDSARLRRLAAPRLAEPLWRALLQQLQQNARIALRGSFVHLPEHGVRLSAVDERIAQAIAPMLDAAGYEGAWARDLARDAGENEPLLRVAVARLAQRGDLHQVVRDLVYDTATMRRLAAIARDLATANGAVTAAAFRDATALGRKRAIQILEYFDRAGLLRRMGDEHRLRTDSRLFLD
jgi:selenocysteine-specific elongation factor